MKDDTIDLLATKEAAKLLGEFGADLATTMSAGEAFHAMLAGAVTFGVGEVGPQPVAAWLRILADVVDKAEAKH